jgi:hypothetical protein
MPDAAEFLKGFGFIEGKQISGYKILLARSSHQSIKRYQEYYYDITIKFKDMGNGNYNNLYSTMLNITSQEHIIYGIKNPYRCIIDNLDQDSIVQEMNDIIVFHLIGHSYRV